MDVIIQEVSHRGHEALQIPVVAAGYFQFLAILLEVVCFLPDLLSCLWRVASFGHLVGVAFRAVRGSKGTVEVDPAL
jgi:hypothetical protein